MFFNGSRIHEDLFDTQVFKAGLIGINLVVQIDCNLVDDLVASLLLDIGAHQCGLISMHVVLCQDLLYGIDPCLNGRLITGGTVLPQQVLQYIGRDDSITLDRLDEILADNQPREMCINLLVKLVHHLAVL